MRWSGNGPGYVTLQQLSARGGAGADQRALHPSGISPSIALPPHADPGSREWSCREKYWNAAGCACQAAFGTCQGVAQALSQLYFCHAEGRVLPLGEAASGVGCREGTRDGQGPWRRLHSRCPCYSHAGFTPDTLTAYYDHAGFTPGTRWEGRGRRYNLGNSNTQCADVVQHRSHYREA